MHPDRRMKWTAGFTLLEVMIALGIFAICAAILLKQSGLSARQSAYLEHKTQATWIAENTLAELRLQAQWPSTGKQTRTLLQGQREWTVEVNTSETSNPDLRRVLVNVRLATADDALHSGTSLTGYIGRY